MSAGEDNIFRSFFFFKELTGILVLRLLRALTVGVSILRTCDNSSFLRLHGGGADPGVQFIHQGK